MAINALSTGLRISKTASNKNNIILFILSDTFLRYLIGICR